MKINKKPPVVWILTSLVVLVALVATVLILVSGNTTEKQPTGDVSSTAETNGETAPELPEAASTQGGSSETGQAETGSNSLEEGADAILAEDQTSAEGYALLEEYISENYTDCDAYEPLERERFDLTVRQRFCERQLEGGASYNLQITRFDGELAQFLEVLTEFENRCFEKNHYLASLGDGFAISAWLYYEDGLEPEFYSPEYNEELDRRTEAEHELLEQGGLEVELVNVCV